MELIHFTNNGRQILDVKEPRHYDEILGRVTLTDSHEQQMPWSAIRAIRLGKLPIGQVASVMYAVMERSPIVAEALARSVSESQLYTEGYPDFQCPRDWLSEAADIVSPEFLAAKSWTLGEEVVSCNWWANKPNTISLMSPPEVAAATIRSMDDTAAGQLTMLIDIHRDEPEFARRVAACINRDWQAFLMGDGLSSLTGEALDLADAHGFLPGTYTAPTGVPEQYKRDFIRWAAAIPGVHVSSVEASCMLYNGMPLTGTVEAIIAAFESDTGY
jgi:hypothetical protein|nr:MAG TPA: hypothetical protein [Caudoviricetes sp.]